MANHNQDPNPLSRITLNFNSTLNLNPLQPQPSLTLTFGKMFFVQKKPQT